MDSNLVLLRPYRLTDEAFVYKTFLEGLRYGNETFRQMDKIQFYENYRKVLNSLIQKKETQIKIAALKEDPDVILGYAITRPEIVDWIFVKKSWRRLGIAKDLIGDMHMTTVSHITLAGNAIRTKLGLKYDPFK
jgi:hypothetical protein